MGLDELSAETVIRMRIGASAIEALACAEDVIGDLNQFLGDLREKAGSTSRARIAVEDASLVIPLDAIEIVRHWLVVASDPRLHAISLQMRSEACAAGRVA